MSDVRARLRGAAPRTVAPPDLRGMERTAHARRRARRTTAAIVVAVVLGGTAAVLATLLPTRTGLTPADPLPTPAPSPTSSTTALPPLPFEFHAREGMSSVWNGSEWLLVGGDPGSGDDRGGTADGVRYDPVQQRWAAIPPDPAGARPSFTHAALWEGTGLVWAGSVPASSPLRAGEALGPVRVSAFDLVGGTWQGLPSPPLSPRIWLTSVPTDDGLVVWGGRGEDGEQRRDGAVLDGARNWRPTAPVPFGGAQRVESHAAGDRLVVVHTPVPPGDRTFDAPLPPSEIAVYDPATDSWNDVPVPAGPFLHDGAVAWTGRELLIAAADGTVAVDPAAGTARDLGPGPPSFPSGNVIPGAVWTGERMLIVGTTLAALDPENGQWSDQPAPGRIRGGAVTWTGSALLWWGDGDGEFDLRGAPSDDVGWSYRP